MSASSHPTSTLAQTITINSSKQTAWTIETLVPAPLRSDAFRAYAYFRWVDDVLDGDELDRIGRRKFLRSQKALLQACLADRPPRELLCEEWMLVDLMQGALGDDPGLHTYLQDMMAVMEFDVQRRGRRIDQRDLSWYSRKLATAVTEAVYTFIGDSCGAPHTVERYLAADAAHIVHMLRDLHEDLDAGYINVPVEVLPGESITADDLSSAAAREWVRSRVQKARAYFIRGESYLAGVKSPRCRLAGAWYIGRFGGVLKAIEREDYSLRRDYSDCRGLRTIPRLAFYGGRLLLAPPSPRPPAVEEPVLQPAWSRERLPSGGRPRPPVDAWDQSR